MALDQLPAQRGLAASCQMFLQASVNSLAAGASAPLLWGSTRTLAAGMLGLDAARRRQCALAPAPEPASQRSFCLKVRCLLGACGFLRLFVA